MANRYAEDIRQIVGVDGTKGGIAVPEPKRSIAGGRGIAWFNSDGSIGSGSGLSGGSSSPTIQPDDADDGTGNASGTTGGGGGGSTGDSGITQDDATNPNSVDATALFDNLAIGASSPSEVTGLFDCNTNQEYILRTDGEFTAPDGWEDADTPPIDPQYEDGFYWGKNSAFNNKEFAAPTRDGSWELFKESRESLGFVIVLTLVEELITNIKFRYSYTENGGPDSYDTTRVSCSVNYNAVCEITPILTEWPEAFPAQLTYDRDSAAWLTNDYDGNIPLEYSGASASQIELCDSNGDQIQIQPSTNGGLVYTNATDNIFWVRGPDGKITAAGSGSARDMYVAK